MPNKEIRAIGGEWMDMSSDIEQIVIAKITRRIVLFCFILFFVNYLDRVNVGFAALDMNKELGLTATIFGLGGGIFYLGYAIFEIPSNLILHKVGPRVWLARIMITWGIVSAAFVLTAGVGSFLTLRFLLGLAEAGFVPGVIVYLTYWFPSRYRAKAFASFLTATALSSVIGAPLSTLIMSGMDGVAGFSGWRWMFILEAIPSIILGFVILKYMVERPAEASWLSVEERDWLTSELERDELELNADSKMSVLQVITDKRILHLSALYFCIVSSILAILLWLPQIIKEVGKASTIQTGFIAAIPYFAATVFMVIIARSSDRLGERRWHITGCSLLGFASLMASAYASTPTLALVFVTIAAMGIWGALGIYWSVPAALLSGKAAAVGIAFINTVSVIGGFIGPFWVGWIRDATGDFKVALISLSSFALMAAVLSALLPAARPDAKDAAFDKAPA